MEKLIIKPIFLNFLKNDNGNFSETQLGFVQFESVQNEVPAESEETKFRRDFIGEPNLSKKQSNVHYQGHYMKYIKKFNLLIAESIRNFVSSDSSRIPATDKKLYKLYKKSKCYKDFRNTLIIASINFFDENSDVYHNASQIYNHELYWSTLTTKKESLMQLCKLKNKLFTNEHKLSCFYEKFINDGISHFGSGWLWIYYDNINKKISTMTTHDSKIPKNNIKILGCIDLWEHAYYIDYESDRKKYLEKSFQIINWEKIRRGLEDSN